jgi:hypothetical protein
MAAIDPKLTSYIDPLAGGHAGIVTSEWRSADVARSFTRLLVLDADQRRQMHDAGVDGDGDSSDPASSEG